MQRRDDLVPQQARHHDVALFSRMQLAAPLTRQIKGNARDALNFVCRIDCRVDGAALAVFQRDDFFRRAEIRATGQFAQNENIQAFDQLTLQGRGFSKRRIAQSRSQIGEQIQILAQPQQARFRPVLVRHLVPLRPAHGAEQHSVSHLGLGNRLICHGHAVLVVADAAHKRGFRLERDFALLIEKRNHALHLRHNFGADAVTWEQQEGVGGHGASSRCKGLSGAATAKRCRPMMQLQMALASSPAKILNLARMPNRPCLRH